jgi:hypothetical protein
MICIPFGKPFSPKPAGIAATGRPAIEAGITTSIQR